MSELQRIARLRFGEGKLEEFTHLPAHCAEIVWAKDPGTLQYEICLNDDRSGCIVIERYQDSEALRQHAARRGDRVRTERSFGTPSPTCPSSTPGVPNSGSASAADVVHRSRGVCSSFRSPGPRGTPNPDG